jgi:hypothetical protein
LIRLARRDDEKPGVVVGAIAVLRSRLSVICVLVQAMATHKAGEVIE